MKEKDNDEEQEEEIINTNSKNIIIENPQSPKENSPLESLTEINSEFSENIYFTHFYLAQRELDFEPKPNGDVIPYMMSRDFLYSLFEDKKNYKNANNETYQQILGRVKQFMNSNDDNFNKIFLDHFTYYWDVLGKKNAENIIIPVLSKITEDKIGTRIYFLKKLKNFLEFFEQLGEEGIDIIKNNILNIIEQLYRNKLNPDKKNLLPKKFVITEEEKKEHDDLLFERLLQCCKILIKSKYKEELFKNILELINIEENNDNNNIIIFKKILSIKLMTNLSADFGEEFTKKNIVPILDEFLTKNEDIKIKEETAMSLIILVQKLKIDFIGEYVINSLEKISNDKFWIIRKKCIEILYKIIPELNKEKDQEENKIIKDYETKIIALIEKFIEDKNEKVRFYLIEKIGEIIKSIPENYLSEKLFNFYIKSIEEYYSDEENLINNKLEKGINPDRKINFYFWYNFPAILFKYGKEKWNELSNIYKYITKEDDIILINSIISSFYEISKILGKEITVKELLPLYNNFLENNNNYFIRDLAEKHLYKILSILDKETREEYFNKYNIGFNSIIKSEQENNYLINSFIQNKKISYLKNISTFYQLYDNDTIYKDILSKCIYFSMDPIYKVRTTSCKIISEIILYLYKNNYEKEKIIKLIGSYALNKKSNQRISFIKISKYLLLTDTPLYETILKRLIYIIAIKEQNANVLIALAKCLKKIVTNKNIKNANDPGIHFLCKKINNGKNMSISRIFRNVKIQNVQNIEGIGDIFEENMFVQNDIYFEKEFGIQLRKKNSTNPENVSINNDKSKEDKFIN
jgi:hypothetical protein